MKLEPSAQIRLLAAELRYYAKKYSDLLTVSFDTDIDSISDHITALDDTEENLRRVVNAISDIREMTP